MANTETKTDGSSEATTQRKPRKTFIGRVSSDKMNKTVTVKVERRVPHPLYGKIVRRYTTLKAHDEQNEAKTGDMVEVMECRPLSKTKRFRLVRIVQAASR